MLVGFEPSDTSKLTKTSTTGTNRKFTAHIDTKRRWRRRIYKNRGCAKTQHKLTQNTNRISSIQNAPAKNDVIVSISDRLHSESHKTDRARITERTDRIMSSHIISPESGRGYYQLENTLRGYRGRSGVWGWACHHHHEWSLVFQAWASIPEICGGALTSHSDGERPAKSIKIRDKNSRWKTNVVTNEKNEHLLQRRGIVWKILGKPCKKSEASFPPETWQKRS